MENLEETTTLVTEPAQDVFPIEVNGGKQAPIFMDFLLVSL